MIMAGHHLAMDPGDAVGTLPGIPTTEPAFGLPAIWIPEVQHAEAEALGYTVVDGESVIVTHLTETIREPRRPAAHAARRTPASGSAKGNQRSCRYGDCARCSLARRDPARVAVSARRRASRSATSARSSSPSATRRGSRATPPCWPSTPARRSGARSPPRIWTRPRPCASITLDPTIEQELATSITQTSDGEYLAMEPIRAQAVLTAVKSQSDHAAARGGMRPVLLCSARVRRHLRRLVESAVPHLPSALTTKSPPASASKP